MADQQQRLPAFTRTIGAADRFKPGAKPKNVKSTLHRIIDIYLRFGKSIFTALLLTLLSSAAAVGIPYFTGRALQALEDNAKIENNLLLAAVLAILALQLTNWLVSSIAGYLMMQVSQKLVYILRQELFVKMQKLPLSYYDTNSHGDIMSRMTNDVDNISSTIAQSATQLFSGFLTITGALIVMLCLNITLTLTVLISVPLVVFLTKGIAARSHSYFFRQQQNLGTMNGMIEEYITGLKMVRAFDQRDEILKDFCNVNEELCQSSTKAQIWSGFMMPMLNVINNLIFTLVALAGGILSIGYGLSIGTVVSFLSYSKQFAHPLNSLAGLFNTLQSALAGAERVFEVLDQQNEREEDPDCVTIEKVTGKVEFCKVSFSYDLANKDKAPVLDQVSFVAEPGSKIAIVGETGCGKTTLVNLLTRFYEADSGMILIDGIPVTNLARDCLRTCFSVVLQETCLFSGSIMENIRYSRPKASDDEVIKAARLSHAHEFIEKLPEGYHTQVSGTAVNLSQGECQLLAIARAVLCNAPILILDEATSAVDTMTEKAIQKGLANLMNQRTSFFIAHRLSTISDADCILVLKNGKVAEQGNHEILMEKKGIYYRMVKSQSPE